MTKQRGVQALALLGLLGSWALFAAWMAANEWDFVGAWVAAFTTCTFSTGLHVDLLAVSGMLVLLAIAERRSIGARSAPAVVASLALGACVSLAVYLTARWRTRHAELAQDAG